MNAHLNRSFSHITDWIFDLDNTLYPSSARLFEQMDVLITHYVMDIAGLPFDKARLLQKKYYREFGTTLRGLMSEHGVDPADYLKKVHDMDYSVLPPNPELGTLIASLPGRKHIFTNGDVPHAERVLNALEIGHNHFDGMFDIVGANYLPKPRVEPYDAFIATHDLEVSCSAMFEDMARNLEVPKQKGMATVLIVEGNPSSKREGWEKEGHNHPHVDHVTSDINGFLSDILSSLQISPQIS